MILPESRLSESASTPAPGLSSQPKSGGGKEPGTSEGASVFFSFRLRADRWTDRDLF